MADAPKAARLTDNHLCPQHIGKEINANTASTILIEGQPAARITSKMVCIGGPPDAVAMGEPTVLMMGLDAARMLDGTDHGGLVSQGAATVLIGSMSAMAKRLRLLARLALIDAGRRKAAEMPDGPDRMQLLLAANRLAQNNHVVEDARLAENVYEDSGAPEGWTRVDSADMPPGLQNATFSDPDSGFYSAVYRSDIDGTYRLVFRGSETDGWDDINDWTTNAGQGTGFNTTQYQEAVQLAQQFAAAYGPDNASIVGHSLGGGLASAAALASGLPANTFNSSGLSDGTLERLEQYGFDTSQAPDLIDAYQTDGDILTWLAEDSPIAGAFPDAAGTTHSTPAYDYNPQTGELTARPDQYMEAPPLWVQLFGPLANLFWAGKFVSEAAHRHNNFIGGIEKQKADDITAIEAALGVCMPR